MSTNHPRPIVDHRHRWIVLVVVLLLILVLLLASSCFEPHRLFAMVDRPTALQTTLPTQTQKDVKAGSNIAAEPSCRSDPKQSRAAVKWLRKLQQSRSGIVIKAQGFPAGQCNDCLA